MFYRKITLLLLALSVAAACGGITPDLVIRNGLVIDGSGDPGEILDIAILDGRILEVGPSLRVSGAREIDAAGFAVCPGFIDIHSHAERDLLEQPDNHNNILQGITTLVGGNCGSSPVDMREFLERLSEAPLTTNVACLVGHNSVRQRVMGMRDAEASHEELEEMRRLVRQAMLAGAAGFSTGLLYPPGTFSGFEEVLALAKVAAEYGGIYASHIRSEEQAVWEAVDEALRIGGGAGIRTEISHIKLAAEEHWGEAERYMGVLSSARAQGIQVMADQYPYRAGSATLENILPRWSLDGGREAFLERARDPKTRAQIRQDILKGRLASVRGRNRGEIVYVARCKANPKYEGKNLIEICRAEGLEETPEMAAEMAIRLLEQGPVSAVNFLMNEEDVRAFLKSPNIMISTDGGVTKFGEGVPHPRNYGTYPRLLGHYARDEKVLSLEEAVRKATRLPAGHLNLADRGRVSAGAWADLVIFEPETIIDKATFQQPHQYPVGIVYVLVNGQVAVERGRISEARAGRVIRGPGWDGGSGS